MVIKNLSLAQGGIIQLYISPGTYTLDEIAEELTGVWSEGFFVPDFNTIIKDHSPGFLIQHFTNNKYFFFILNKLKKKN